MILDLLNLDFDAEPPMIAEMISQELASRMVKEGGVELASRGRWCDVSPPRSPRKPYVLLLASVDKGK